MNVLVSRHINVLASRTARHGSKLLRYILGFIIVLIYWVYVEYFSSDRDWYTCDHHDYCKIIDWWTG